MIMKRIILILIVGLLSLSSHAVPRKIIINNGKPQHNHSDIPVPADEPEVYYDSTTQEIIIDGMGFVSYYDVEITSMSTSATVLTTQVGSYDTIDISSLAADDYLITIDTPLGNTYEGYFDTY